MSPLAVNKVALLDPLRSVQFRLLPPQHVWIVSYLSGSRNMCAVRTRTKRVGPQLDSMHRLYAQTLRTDSMHRLYALMHLGWYASKAADQFALLAGRFWQTRSAGASRPAGTTAAACECTVLNHHVRAVCQCNVLAAHE